MLFSANPEETLLSSGSGIELSLKMGPKRPKLENVTMMEWTAANAKIMAKLLLEGKLSSPNSAQYLAYTVKIASLAQRYMWQSILLYDREYRRAQATYNFPWGSDIQHLVTTHLVPRYNAVTPSKAVGDLSGNTIRKSVNPDLTCKLFNHSVCTYGNTCRYKHVCNVHVCRGSHPQFQHPR